MCAVDDTGAGEIAFGSAVDAVRVAGAAVDAAQVEAVRDAARVQCKR